MNANQSPSRQVNYDYLRIVACLMVITIHAASPFVAGGSYPKSLNFVFGAMFDAFSLYCIPIFVMLSGAFILGNPKNADRNDFYGKNMARIAGYALIWNVIYFVANTFIQPDYSAVKMLITFGSTEIHLWYMSMIVMLYAATPFLMRAKNMLGNRSFFSFGLVLSVLSMFACLTPNPFWVIGFLFYIGYYICGDYIKNHLRTTLKPWFWISLSAICAITLFALETTLTESFPKIFFKLNDYLNPLVMIGGFALFIAFANMNCRPNRFIASLAKHSLNIYLVHLLVLYFCVAAAERLLPISEIDNTYNLLWYIPGLALTVLFISYFISLLIYAPSEWLIRKAFMPWIGQLINKITSFGIRVCKYII